MMLSRILPLPVAKEVHALLPLWLGGVAALVWLTVAAGVTSLGPRILEVWGILVYGGTSVALGALSIGHEYNHRTLPLMLCQPASRARLLAVKLLVLAIMLLALAGVARGTVLLASKDTAMAVMLAVLCGLCLAPWLTMLCRSPLAGAVFTGPITGWIWVLVTLNVTPSLQLVVFQRAMLGLSAITAALGWWTFMRLEVIEGRGAAIQWPSAARLSPGRVGGPIWRLVKKELGLQQLSLAVVAFYFASWLVLLATGQLERTGRISGGADLFFAATFLYSGVMALLIGAMASAEERQLGTLEWQVLLPMASSKQWAVKVGTTFGLALLLAGVLPALMHSFMAGRRVSMLIGLEYSASILLLATASLYVSSLSSSGFKALLLAIPVSLFVAIPILKLASSINRTRFMPVPMGLLALALLPVLYFALLNHRSTDRSVWRVCKQVFVMAGCLLAAAELLTLMR
jgi:hypothetical protein